MLRFDLDVVPWRLLAFDPQLGDYQLVEDRRCPNCGQSFREYTADQLKDRFWPGGMAK